MILESIYQHLTDGLLPASHSPGFAFWHKITGSANGPKRSSPVRSTSPMPGMPLHRLQVPALLVDSLSVYSSIPCSSLRSHYPWARLQGQANLICIICNYAWSDMKWQNAKHLVIVSKCKWGVAEKGRQLWRSHLTFGWAEKDGLPT